MTLIEQLNLYKTESLEALQNFDFSTLDPLCQAILEAYDRDSTVYFCGNGGNSSTCEHWVCDLSLHPLVSEDKKVYSGFRAIKAISLCQNSSLLTSITNDLGSNYIFSAQINMFGKEGDILIGLSGSGTSVNITEALAVAEVIGMNTFLITKNPDVFSRHNTIKILSHSQFPGNTGSNEGNFYYEEMILKISHVTTGLLREHIWNR